MMLWSLQDLCRSTQQLFAIASKQLLQEANPYNAIAFPERLKNVLLEDESSPLVHLGLVCDRPDFLPQDLERLQARQS